jgi:diguanylate cyclase (GGDEF)-like protein
MHYLFTSIDDSMLIDSQVLQGVLNAIADSIVWVNGYGEIEGCNLAFERLVNQPRAALLRSPLTQILPLEYWGHPLPIDQHPLTLAKTHAKGVGHYCIKQSQQQPIRLSWVQVSQVGSPRTVLTLSTDADYQDPLTGLANRAFITQWLHNQVRDRQDGCATTLVLMIDIERFKVINDGLGYAVGDQLLVAIAQRLQSHLNATDILARLNGDEFCILTNAKAHPHLALVEQIQHSMRQPFTIDSHTVSVTLSIGIVIDTTSYQSASDILRDADNAMYRAKSKGPGCYEVFQAKLHHPVTAQLQLETDLRQAIEREELVIHYQPVVSIRNQRLLGFEALVRWHHPHRGLVFPSDFIPLAEETGLIVPLGWWVLHQACLQLKTWQVQYQLAESFYVSVNISGRQFTQPNLVEQIQSILDEIGLPPPCLKLELTESMLMDRVDSVIELLDRLKVIGVKISVDDFGTGYSSLGYLTRFPIDTLKIDRSFVENVESDPEKLEIVKTIVMLAWNLGMDVVAEGVENQKQLHQLKALQCESGQGFFFAKPMDAKAATAYLAAAQQHN